MAMDLAELCNRIAWDERVRVVVLGFDGGLDSGVSRRIRSTGVAERLSLAEPVAGLKQPVIAAIRGDALGPGSSWRLRVISGSERKMPVSVCRRSGRELMPADGGTQRLPRLVGQGKAMQMILTGERD